MRHRAALIVVALLASAVMGTIAARPALAAPAGCRDNANGITEYCDQHIATAGPRGSIGLLGDAAQALALTVSAKNSTDAGYLTVYRCGDSMPPTSNVTSRAELSERLRSSPRSPALAPSVSSSARQPM